MNAFLLLPRYMLLLGFWLMPLAVPALQAPPTGRPASSQEQETAAEAQRLQPGRSTPAEQPAASPFTDFDSPLWTLVWVLVVLASAYFLIRLLTAALHLRAARTRGQEKPMASLLSLIRVGVWLLALVVVAGILLPSAAGALVLWGVIGIALAFAAQDVLKNILGGISLITDAPFAPGDKIRVGTHYGEVVSIGLRFTRLRTQDDSLIAIPNALFLNNSLSNATGGESSCQVVATLFLPLAIDTSQVRHLALEAAHVSRYIYQNKPVSVHFSHELRHTKTWLKMELTAHVLDIQYELAFRSELTELLMRELTRSGLMEEEIR